MMIDRLQTKNIALVVAITFLSLGSADVVSATTTEAELKIKNVTKIAPQIEMVQFKSQALGTKKSFCVVLPPDSVKQEEEKGGRPFLFLLHGSGRNERTLIDNRATRQILLDAGFTIVLPDGDSAWYVDSSVNSKAKYATYTDEVLRLAESRYRLSRDPKKRAIAGWSMGGYGAIRFAQTHPNEFSTIASMIGVIDYPRAPEEFPSGQSYRLRKDCFGDDPEAWKTYNPINFAEKLTGMSILLITGDVAFDRTMNENFRKKLDKLKIPYRFETLKGGHTFDVVQKSLPLVIRHVRTGFGLKEKK